MITIPRQTVRLVRDGKGTRSPEKLDLPEKAVKVFRQLLTGDMGHEEVHVIGIDAQHRPLTSCMISRGGADGAALTVPELFRPLVAAGARAFFMAHNHPSGNASPSRADIALTLQVQAAGNTLQIPLLDHIIIGGDSHYSMFQNGDMS